MGSHEFAEILVESFEESGVCYAKCPELNLVARGDTPTQALLKLMNMVTLSLDVAAMRGNLKAVLEHAGIRVLANHPGGNAPSDNGKFWFLPLMDNAGSRSVR
jgi:hypothetical protein